MKELLEKTQILLEALPYIQKFRRKTVVIKLGGSAMEKSSNVLSILNDIVFLENVGMRVVIVHGGGKSITKALKKKGIKSEFKGGLRVTDRNAIKVVEDVLVNRVNHSIVKKIESLGGKAIGFSAADNGVLEVKKEYHYEIVKGKKKRVDLGYVGRITNIRTDPIYRLFNIEKIPVIAPLGLGPRGFVYNINADSAACEIAAKLKAEKLIFISDVDGISVGKKLISTLTIGEVAGLTKKGVIHGGMIPKSQSMVKAIRNGVQKTHIINGTMPHALLLEIYTDSGVGTQLVAGRKKTRK